MFKAVVPFQGNLALRHGVDAMGKPPALNVE